MFRNGHKKEPELLAEGVDFWTGSPNSECFVNPFCPKCAVGTRLESIFHERTNSPLIMVIILISGRTQNFF